MTAPTAAPTELESRAVAETQRYRGPGRGQKIGLVLGPVVFGGMLLLSPPEGLSPAGWRTAAVGLFMAIWWITEALPLAVTSLLPLILFPVLEIRSIADSAVPYANPLIFLFLGGFVIAIAIQRWGLHRRIALNIIRAMGVQPRSIIGGFMASAALLSMWVSNTATAMMMMPIGLSVVQVARAARETAGPDADESVTGAIDPSGYSHFAIDLMLGIAYACSIGGMATLIGTPTNALMAGFFAETYGIRIGFVEWMLVGVPLMLVGLPITHFILTYVAFPVRMKQLTGGRELIESELQKMGGMSPPEVRVALISAMVAVLWITAPLLQGLVPGLSDTGIAIFGATLLFLIPSGTGTGEFLLDWESAEALPWGVLLLFGGGLALAAAVSDTGLAEWIGGRLAGVQAMPLILVMLLVATVVILLTELTSNVATAAAFLPVMVALAVGIGQNPLLLAVPTVLAASAAFMLPVATPPNAIVYGSSFLTIPQMARAGLILNVIFIFLVTGITYTLVSWVFGVQPGVVPEWAIGR